MVPGYFPRHNDKHRKILRLLCEGKGLEVIAAELKPEYPATTPNTLRKFLRSQRGRYGVLTNEQLVEIVRTNPEVTGHDTRQGYKATAPR